MAHQQIGAASRPRAATAARKLVERFEAEPVHAGVEVQRRRRRRGLASRANAAQRSSSAAPPIAGARRKAE